MHEVQNELLRPDEPPAVVVERPDGASPLFLTCDHASNRVPAALGTLGLDAAALDGHIAWDGGAAALARALSRRCDAALVLQGYSRLVIDCNRDLASPRSIPPDSDGVPIPGNHGLDAAAAESRAAAIYRPYHAAIARALDERAAAGRATVYVAVHSFTPEMRGAPRPWQIGLVHNQDPSFARLLIEGLRADGDLTVGDNQPYSPADEVHHSFHVHAERRGLPHAMVEVRDDVIADPAGVAAWAERLARHLDAACTRIGVA